MNGMLRRLLKLEPPAPPGAVRIVWNDGSEAAKAEAERLTGEGYRVTLVGWAGDLEPGRKGDPPSPGRSI